MSQPIHHFRFPAADDQFYRTRYYVEDQPVPEYLHASAEAREAFADMKYGIRIHWGLYSLISGIEASWPLALSFNNEQRQAYQQSYQQFHPASFDADQWMKFFTDCGMKMFAFTTKHQDGFSLFDTKANVKQRMNWLAPGGPKIEDCDFAYSVMDTPFKRDVVKELCDAAHKHGIKIDLYYTHPDWYDADFRSFGLHPVQTPEYRAHPERFGNATGFVDPAIAMAPDQTDAEIQRMMHRYGQQVRELLTHYGKIDMICFDQWLGPKSWPYLRNILIQAKRLQPDVMFRARGIGNYGDYHTPEDVVPGSHDTIGVPWFVIHRQARLFAYDPDASQYKSAVWVLHTLIDIVAKGGNFMICVGPDKDGQFHPKAVESLQEVGVWLKLNSRAIYATRPREHDRWREGHPVYYTRNKARTRVYAILIAWPGSTVYLYTVKPNPGSTIRMIGVDQPLTWRLEGIRLTIDIPKSLQEENNRPCKHAWVLEIEVSE